MRSIGSFIMLCKMAGHGIQAEEQNMVCREWKERIFV